MENLEQLEDGQVRFDLRMAARMRLYGRLQEWYRGIRLFSISADAWSDVELALKCELSTSLDSTKLPPDVLIRPNITSAELKLVQFKLQRLSKADGPIVREFGDGLEDILRKNLRDKNERLVGKLNRQIEKHQDDLRLSVSDWMKQTFTKSKEWLNPVSRVAKKRGAQPEMLS